MLKMARICFLCCAMILSSCQAKASPTPVLPSPTAFIYTQIPTGLDTPYSPAKTSAYTPPPSIPTSSSSPSEIHATLPSGLTIDEYALIGPPELEPLTFTPLHSTFAEIRAKHEAERLNPFPDISYFDEKGFSMSASLQGQKLVATEVYTSTAEGDSFGAVNVYRDDELVDKIPIGPGSQMAALRGLWTYDQNWVVETAYLITSYDPETNSNTASVTGQIVVDGLLLNEQQGWEEGFGFQTLHGRPFYFFKQAGKINLSYDGQVVPVDYEAVPHYQCCSAGILNPQPANNMVSFFAQKNGTWYYVEAGVYSAQP